MMKMEKMMMMMIFVLMMTSVIVLAASSSSSSSHDYGDALSKSILFFEGQRSGKLPPSQRITWRKDSALRDGSDVSVDLVGGYYDAGDNMKFHFPMAFSTTILAWGVVEFGKFMGPDLQHALEAIRWGTDYFLKATTAPGVVYAQVGEPYSDHSCWERPEDMDTPRTTYKLTKKNPGSELSGEIAAALAASSLAFRASDPAYSKLLLQRASKVFQFADKYRGSYDDSLGEAVCPFYCSFNGYQDELIWAAAWLHKATKKTYYWNYVTNNITSIKLGSLEFGWDSKHAGINILASKFAMNTNLNVTLFLPNANKFVCSILPESPSLSISYSPGGLLFKPGGTNMQHVTALSFVLLVYARYLDVGKRVIHCDDVAVTRARLVRFARSQVDYILGNNPLNMSYMVGYGNMFPQRIHHRGSSLPSIDEQPKPIRCADGTPFFSSTDPNPNLLLGAVVGGPDMEDSYVDSKADFAHSEPTTYINSPLVGILAYFKVH